MKKLFINLLKRNTSRSVVITRSISGIEKEFDRPSDKVFRPKPFGKLIDGHLIANEIIEDIGRTIDGIKKNGWKRPVLVIVQVADLTESNIYINHKLKAAEKVGIKCQVARLPETIKQDELLLQIEQINNDKRVHGLIVQLPLPSHINEDCINNAIDHMKDVDGFHDMNIGKLTGYSETIVPATANAVREIISRINLRTRSKTALVIGRSRHLGSAISIMLSGDEKRHRRYADMTTIIAHRCTPYDQLKDFCLLSDVIVSAAGVPGLITSDMIRNGTEAVIDVGCTRIFDPIQQKYIFSGDIIDVEGVRQHCNYLSPVPGGVGPITVAMLLRNTLNACVDIQKKQLEDVDIDNEMICNDDFEFMQINHQTSQDEMKISDTEILIPFGKLEQNENENENDIKTKIIYEDDDEHTPGIFYSDCSMNK
ncbi:hypothetical protein SNEBB_011115 [Seison nebaliae]|nr:hypothetical protein SNEBB_011115 [Seison nebaliae]